MKQNTPVAWALLAALSVGLLLLVDPLAWFGAERAAEPLTSPSTGAADDDEVVHHPTAGVTASDPAHARTDAGLREVVDPVAEAGLACFRVVLGSDRQVVVGAQVLVARDDRLLLNARTDAAGEVTLAADGRAAGLCVAIPRRPLEWRHVVLDFGRHEIALGEGARVAGRFVTDDGRAPGKLSITVDSDHALTPVDGVPEVVADALSVRALRLAYSIVETDADGALELTGLPASWSGTLSPRDGFRVTATTHGIIQPGARGIRLTEPASDFVVHVATRPTLRGRLLLRDDGAPVDRAQVMMMVRSPDAPPVNANAWTDAEGRFEVEVAPGPVGSLELRLGLSRDAPSLLVLEGARVPADGDLGDIAVDGVRHVPFLLQEPNGAPIARGIAAAGGVTSRSTGRDGRGELRWVPRAAVRMEVEAPGFVPAEAEIPPVLSGPLAVTMQPAAELAVALRLPAGAESTQFEIVLRGAERITAVPVADQLAQRRHVSEWTYPPARLYGTAPDTFLCSRPDAVKGTATFRALRPGVALELMVCGMTGDMVYHSEAVAPLAEAEHRELVVSLEHGMLVFRGRVLDQDGAPLARATVQLGGQILDFTDDQGGFLCYLAEPKTATLVLQHRACATRFVRDYAVPVDGSPVEFRLGAARPVTIEVVDTNGAPVPQAEVWTRYSGFTTNTHRVEGNRHVASSVPEGPFEIVARLAGREYRVQHDPSLATARVVVPVHGRVVAQIADATTAERAGEFVVVLVPPGDTGAAPVSARRRSAPGLRIEVPAVHPGTYQASLRYEPSAEEREAGGAEATAAAVPIVVEAGREAEVRLALPAGPHRGG